MNSNKLNIVRIVLNEDQRNAYDKINLFINKPFPDKLDKMSDEDSLEHIAITLEGYAGTGKTTLTRFILRSIRNKVVGIAPTHKAKRVLDDNLNIGMFKSTPTMTIASLMKSVRDHTYTGTKKFISTGTKIAEYDIFIVDEVSMVADKDLGVILGYARALKKKFIFIGDPAQIPSPSQGYVLTKDNYLIKRDSRAFRVIQKVTLTNVIRQQKDNPILDVITNIRENLYGLPDFSRENRIIDGKGVLFIDNHDNFVREIMRKYRGFVRSKNKLITDYIKIDDEKRKTVDVGGIELNVKELMNTKIIGYTNQCVVEYNEIVRRTMGLKEMFVKGELIMGYNNVGFPKRILENGQDYEIVSVNYVDDHQIILNDDIWMNLVGWKLKIIPIYTHIELIQKQKMKSNMIFVPDIYNENNKEILEELMRRAEENNKIGSVKSDFKHYMMLKSKMMFKETLYKFDERILTGSELSKEFSILFTRVSDLIEETDKGRVIDEKKMKRYMELREIIEYRIKDKKSISDNETFADRFQILDKDFDYGYAITAHKSQGSTYDNIYINEKDFNKICDRVNPKYQLLERRGKERNQLLYVSYSRARSKVVVYF